MAHNIESAILVHTLSDVSSYVVIRVENSQRSIISTLHDLKVLDMLKPNPATNPGEIADSLVKTPVNSRLFSIVALRD